MGFKKKIAAFIAAAMAFAVLAVPSAAETSGSGDLSEQVTASDEVLTDSDSQTKDEEEKSPITEYSVFEAVRIRRDILNDGGTYTKDDYDQLVKFLINDSILNIRYFTFSYDIEGLDLSNYSDPSVLDPKEVAYKSRVKVTGANFPREGYVSMGWEYNGVMYNSGDMFTMPAEDVVLTPVWYRRSKITYYAGDYDDIKGNTSSYVYSSEQTQYFLADTTRFTRTGYTISGWKCLNDGEIYSPGSYIIVPAEDLTFEAIWSPAVYNISLSANNGNINDRITMKGTYNEEFVLPECEFENEGKTFAGWRYDGTIYQPGESFIVPAIDVGAKIVVVATWE